MRTHKLGVPSHRDICASRGGRLATAAGWSLANTGNDLDADLTGTLDPAASRFFWIRVMV